MPLETNYREEKYFDKQTKIYERYEQRLLEDPNAGNPFDRHEEIAYMDNSPLFTVIVPILVPDGERPADYLTRMEFNEDSYYKKLVHEGVLKPITMNCDCKQCENKK